MTASAIPIGTACELAGLACSLQRQQQGINSAGRVRVQQPGFFNPQRSAALDHAQQQNSRALSVVMRTLSLFPAANDC